MRSSGVAALTQRRHTCSKAKPVSDTNRKPGQEYLAGSSPSSISSPAPMPLPSNTSSSHLGLTGQLDALGKRTRDGDVDDPLQLKRAKLNGMPGQTVNSNTTFTDQVWPHSLVRLSLILFTQLRSKMQQVFRSKKKQQEEELAASKIRCEICQSTWPHKIPSGFAEHQFKKGRSSAAVGAPCLWLNAFLYSSWTCAVGEHRTASLHLPARSLRAPSEICEKRAELPSGLTECQVLSQLLTISRNRFDQVNCSWTNVSRPADPDRLFFS
eukprot:758371-Hanusia_phi.AAC.2